jgi:Domain of unknown function (DUF4926)
VTLHEHETVVLTRDLPEHRLQAGDVGVVVHAYDGGKAYEVEFVTGSGQTLALETLEPSDIRALGDGDLLHIRKVAAA